MALFGDYTEGLPVKISERYKRPPRIELGRATVECEERARRALAAADYGFAFEGRVLEKLAELRGAKETIASERRHRLRLQEQRRLDCLAAAEAAERLKQLSVSDVSYPSTDEISEMSPDEVTAGAVTPAASDVSPPLLRPVQLSAGVPLRMEDLDLLTDPDPLRRFHINMTNSRYSYTNHNIDKLTFSDFENDTSSPFDNMELKSINDLDLLAQVLQNERVGVANEPRSSDVERGMGSTSIAPLAEPHLYSETPIVGHDAICSPPSHPYLQTDAYYLNNDNICDNSNMCGAYTQGYEYYSRNVYNPQPVNGYYGQAMLHMEPNEAHPPASEALTYSRQSYNYYQYPHFASGYTVPSEAAASEALAASADDSRGKLKSRSRSVPDIVKELSDEVACERVRADERSNALAPSSARDGRSEAPAMKGSVVASVAADPLASVPTDLHDMCRSISRMGFPLPRVARLCSLLGDNDKKVVEGLLLVGQLMELGFSESRVAAALHKHHFNRDKALEELIA